MAVESTWVVALGASGSDGLSDLRQIVRILPASLNAVVLIVWHRPLIPVADLAAMLVTDARLPVSLAGRGEKFLPKNIYVGEPTDHLALAARMYPGLVADPD
jgi:two-component system chemotaxis response regulator CheB